MMLPHEALVINGGCNCKAIRYKVSVPPHAKRPSNPYRTPGADVGDLRLPFVGICHCNNCRSGTSAILPTVLITEISTVEAAMLPYDSNEVPASGRYEQDPSPHWRPAAESFNSATSIPASSPLTFFSPAPYLARWFCRRCGTPVAYSVKDGVLPGPKMLDIWLGTVDRKDLEHDHMKPERMLWCHYGVPWILELARSGLSGVPEHPLTKIDKIVGDDISGDLEEMRKFKESVAGTS